MKKIIKRDLSELNQLIDDLLVTAFEGGSNYWCDKVVVEGDYLGEYASDQISRGGILQIHFDDEVKKLDRDMMVKGINMFIIHQRTTLEDIMNDHDAGDADVVLQFALFNEIVYG